MIFKLTDAGRLFEAQLVAGSKPIITRIEAGDTYSASPDSLLAVQNKKQNLQVEDIAVVDGKTHLKFLLTNLEISSEYYLRQIGIYAKQTAEGAEILYMVGQDKNGERVPAISDREVEYEYDLIISIDNSYEVTLNISGNDFVRKSVLEALDKKKPDSDGGDISEMIVKTLDDITTEFPVPKAGEKLSTFMSKVRKFFEDFNTFKTGIMTLGQLVNNCVTDNPKLPLAASQGKVLMDMLNVLNNNLNGDVLWTNPAPRSAFVAQTLSDIDISDYLSFEISYTASADNPGRVLYSKITRDTYDPSPGNMDWIQHPSNRPAVLACRSAYIANGKINFGDASVRSSTDSSGGVSNGWIIPLSVRGYKYY